MFETRFPATGIRPQTNVIATSVPGSGRCTPKSGSDHEDEDGREDRVHGGDLDLGLRDGAEAVAEAPGALGERGGEGAGLAARACGRRRGLPRRSRGARARGREPRRNPRGGDRRRGRAAIPRPPRSTPPRRGAGARSPTAPKRVLEAGERIPHLFEDGRQVAHASPQEAPEKDDRGGGQSPRPRARETPRRAPGRARARPSAPGAGAPSTEGAPRRGSPRGAPERGGGAAPRGARAPRGRTTSALVRGLGVRGARAGVASSGGIIRCRGGRGGEPVALARRARRARPGGGQWRPGATRRASSSRAWLSRQDGVLEEEKRRDSCEWKKDGGEGGAARADGDPDGGAFEQGEQGKETERPRSACTARSGRAPARRPATRFATTPRQAVRHPPRSDAEDGDGEPEDDRRKAPSACATRSSPRRAGRREKRERGKEFLEGGRRARARRARAATSPGCVLSSDARACRMRWRTRNDFPSCSLPLFTF